MNYNSTLLTTVADCDTLLTMANKEKAVLEFRKTSLTMQLENRTGSAFEVQAELASVNAQIAFYSSNIPGMPEGAEKEKFKASLAKYEYRKVLLTQRNANYGAISQLDSEHDIGKIEKQLEENATFIAVITVRKNEL
ncbi:hypothetical protein [Ferruginibacter sp. HRS2-29]|uniref:hypothetical protein n=1 Tax=Ferruginibacter sp. HRS2-29 TaxID=2487334 RepID=UPI0020CCB60C|nr:hypothetical protein [Ferruginibacter sp. HRS2-29]MCP9751266.1 hypothetical protein [Ferruginibacter sp. HRS2-29]